MVAGSASEAYYLSFKLGFSILIPTWDNLPYLQLCVNSIKRHSVFDHEIIVHINGSENIDQIRAYLVKEDLKYTFSKNNEGVCVGVNSAFKLAKKDLIMYANDDMYFLPEWDVELFNMAKRHSIPELSFISSSMIEPTGNNPCCVAPYDYGTSIETFREHDLLKDFRSLRTFDKQSSTWPPSLWSRKYFEMIGGFDERYNPGMGSDPDIAKKLYDLGCRYFVGSGKSLVYHFQCKSTSKVVKNDGNQVFRRIHGIDIDPFVNGVLRRFWVRYRKPLPKKENLAIKWIAIGGHFILCFLFRIKKKLKSFA